MYRTTNKVIWIECGGDGDGATGVGDSGDGGDGGAGGIIEDDNIL